MIPVAAFLTNGKTDVAVLYASGQIVRYDENQVPVVGLKAGGVRSGSRAIEGGIVEIMIFKRLSFNILFY